MKGEDPLIMALGKPRFLWQFSVINMGDKRKGRERGSSVPNLYMYILNAVPCFKQSYHCLFTASISI